MSGSVNKAILVGNLGRDPEIRSTNSGERIANLTVATSDTWRDKASGERKENTSWHRVVIYNDRLAEVAAKYLTKGSKIYVEGALQTRKWTDNAGQERHTTEIVLQKFRGELTILSRNRNGGNGRPQPGGDYDEDGVVHEGPAAYAGKPGTRAPFGRATTSVKDDLDDEIPF